MKAKFSFTVEKDPTKLLALLPQIVKIGNADKEALGFLAEGALRDAIMRQRLFALTVDSNNTREVAAYVLYSGVFPHAKIQQIAVLEKFRKNGAATALMKCLVSDLERVGFMTIRADVASDLQGPLAFYAKNGFERIRERTGGKARNRTIIIHVRQLDTDSLFSVKSDGQDFDLATRRRSAGDTPFFAFDLNIYFDLVRERTNSDKARQLFGAALAHEIRLAVADEFVTELESTSAKNQPDPILQMALRMPRLPKSDKSQLDTLTAQIHDLVFVKPQLQAAGSKQAKSDARHLAHAALSRASAFVTRDGAILSARIELISKIGIDVIALDELVALLPRDAQQESSLTVQGNGFEYSALIGSDLAKYLEEAKVSKEAIAEFTSENSGALIRREAIREGGRIVAVGAIVVPKGMEPIARLLVHVRQEHADSDMFADYVLDSLTRFACADITTTVELVHVPGQSTTYSLAKARGFLLNVASGNYLKVALGKPLTPDNWSSTVQEIRRRTGLELPDQIPDVNSNGRNITVTTRTGKTSNIAIGKLEDVLGPTIVIWPGREGVIAPITRAYADDLLGTSNQSRFAFVSSPDAAFLSRRAYVNSPRTAKVMRPDSPIFFYESKRKGNGRGAVVAVARIVDSVVVRKSEVPKDGLKRLVVESVDAFSASEDVLLTTFDSLFVFPKPVAFSALKKLDAIGRANLVTAVSLSSGQITKILSQGWSND